MMLFVSIFLLGVSTFAESTDKAPEPVKSKKSKKEKRQPAEEALIESDEDFSVTTHRSDGSEDFSKSPDRLNIVSWKMKTGGFKYDVDRAASVMASADITVLQDIEFNEMGETSVNIIANILEKRMGEKICRGWFKNAAGKRNRFAFIWRDAQIGHLEKTGELRESCSNRPVVMRTETKDYGIATFFLKTNHRLFILNAMDLQNIKNPDAELPRMFRTFSDSDWAVVYAGDTRTSLKHKAFKDVRKWNFKPALAGGSSTGAKSKRAAKKNSLENIWFKNIALITAEPVNLYEQFPELNPAEVDEALGDNKPLRAEFTFSDQEAETIQTQMISKKKGKGPASVAPPVVLKGPSYPAPISPSQLSSLKEDVESEALSTDPAKPVSAKNSKATKKKRKK